MHSRHSTCEACTLPVAVLVSTILGLRLIKQTVASDAARPGQAWDISQGVQHAETAPPGLAGRAVPVPAINQTRRHVPRR
jgi:hypothetical protein